MKILTSLIYLVILIFSLTSCSFDKNVPYQSDGFAMGTVISQTVYGPNAKKASNQVLEKIKYLDSIMTINVPGGDINNLNQNAGKKNVQLHPETLEVISSALKISNLSQGAFDITIGPLTKFWGIGTDKPKIPTKKDLNSLMPLIGYKYIYVDQAHHLAGLRKADQMVDLGGIAKGYAADTAVQIYKKNGINSALISLGGSSITVLGTKPDGTSWNVGIQNPRAPQGQLIGTVKLSNISISTSGDYQKYFEKEGKRYHHIIDPRTGFPADSGLMSVTVVTPSATDADALSKVFVLGLDKGLDLIKCYKNAEAIFVTTDKKIYVTPGLKENFEFNDESKEYEYVQER
jgi:thiamine biosynthesis lipoprotein